MLIPFMYVITSYVKDSINSNVRNVAIYTVVKDIFLTDKGYSDELAKYVSQEVFEKTNIYNVYNVNSPDYKKPFKVEFNLKRDSQSKVNNIVYLKMIYSVKITDSQNQVIGGSRDIPITFTVENNEDDWYITEKEEPA